MLNEQPFLLHQVTRQKFVHLLNNLTVEQLTDIPYGFNNHIWWNIVHVIATQQLLCYYLAKQDSAVPMHWIEDYKKGTFPNKDFVPNEDQIAEIKQLLLSTSTQIKTDYSNGIFNNYQAYPTSYGYTLNNIEDAIRFNNVHEAMHLGTIIAIQKLV